MTELEQIAYDNGVACGFMVARGIGISPLPVEHEMFKYENWTNEMKAMLIEKPYYLMYSQGRLSIVYITFSARPFVYWQRKNNPCTSPSWNNDDIELAATSIRFHESNRTTNTFYYTSSTKTFVKLTTLSYKDTDNGFRHYAAGAGYVTIFYTNGLTSIIENPYNPRKFPLNLIGAAKDYYKPQNYTATIAVRYKPMYSDIITRDIYFTCHGGDIYAYLVTVGEGSEMIKTVYFTNTYLWDICTTAVSDSTKGGEPTFYTTYMDREQVYSGREIWEYTCTIPVFKDKATLTNYLNTNICSASDFEHMPSNYYIDENGKLIKS